MYIKKWILDMLYSLITISETFLSLDYFSKMLFLKTSFFNVIFKNSYFSCLLVLFCANKSIMRSIPLWINNKANLFNLAFVIVLQSPVLTIRRDENDFSHSQVVIGKVPNSFKATCIFGKASEPTQVVFKFYTIPKFVSEV